MYILFIFTLCSLSFFFFFFFFFQAEDGIRDLIVTGVQTCALPIWTFAGVLQSFSVQRKKLCGWRCCPAVRLLLWVKLHNFQIRSLASYSSACEIGRASCRERV